MSFVSFFSNILIPTFILPCTVKSTRERIYTTFCFIVAGKKGVTGKKEKRILRGGQFYYTTKQIFHHIHVQAQSIIKPRRYLYYTHRASRRTLISSEIKMFTKRARTRARLIPHNFFLFHRHICNSTYIHLLQVIPYASKYTDRIFQEKLP